jgi:two-component system response regulator (stage 0 sporulation protein F)
MPRYYGVETFKELKRLNVRSLTVIVTGYPDSDLLAETMKLGPLTIILKPFDLGEIQRAVEALVQMT